MNQTTAEQIQKCTCTQCNSHRSTFTKQFSYVPFLSTPVSDLMMLYQVYHLMTSEVYCVLNKLQHTHVLSKTSVLNPQSQMKQHHMTHLVLTYYTNISP